MKKKVAATFLVTAGLLFSSAFIAEHAEAKSRQAEDQPHDKKTGLANALDHVKNDRAREAIERAMERKSGHHDGRDDDDRGDHRGRHHGEDGDDDDRDDDDQDRQTNESRVEYDKTALAIDFGANDTAASVTVPFDGLPDRGARGSFISWASSAPAVISSDGKTVNRPPSGTGDVNVTLTATLKLGDVAATKTFTVTVKALMTASERVSADKNALTIGFQEGDSTGSVTRPLTLAATGQYGSSISWISSSPTVISNDGKTVNRPAMGVGDAAVVLTAIISNGGMQDVKTFQLLVKQQLTDAQRLAADKAQLEIGFVTGDAAGSVTHPLTLPAGGPNGTTVTWTSSNVGVISNDGKTVLRPVNGSGDVSLVMTAVITYNGLTDVKLFPLTVKQQLTDAEKVAADKSLLAIGYSGNDTAYRVTDPLTLATVGWNGSSVVWVSSNEAFISDDGKTVVRPTGTNDVSVILTAIIISGGVVDTRAYTVVVAHR